jgi:hypothetical protein
MMTLRRLLSTFLGDISLKKNVGVTLVAGQAALLLMLTSNFPASAQTDHSADYTRSSQPPLLTYQELVTLGEQETILRWRPKCKLCSQLPS